MSKPRVFRLLGVAFLAASMSGLQPPPAALSDFTYYADINSSATTNCTPTSTGCTGVCTTPTCGTQVTPCHTIQQAINIANCNIGSNTALEADVLVAAGKYPERIFIYPNIHLIGAGRDVTTIDAKGLNRSAVIMASGAGFGFNRPKVDFSISGFRIIHGSGDRITLTDGGGNSIYNMAGGGMLLYGDGTGWPLVTDCRIEDNTLGNFTGLAAPDWMGAGIYIALGAPVISGNIIQRNTTTPPSIPSTDVTALGWGAGIYSLNFDCRPLITHNIIRNNVTVAEAGDGGGMYVNGSNGTVVSNNLVVANSASDGGGGVYIYSAGVSAYNNVVMGNVGGIFGGGFNVGVQSLYANVTNNTIVGNVLSVQGQAPFPVGGGVYSGFIVPQNPPLVHLTNNLIARNDATSDGNGGGLYSFNAFPTTDHNDFFGDLGDNGSGDLGPNEIRGDYSDADVIGSDGNVSLNPVFTNAPVFWDRTNAVGTSSTAVIYDRALYAVGNRIEYNDDGVSRLITVITSGSGSTGTLTFTPALAYMVCSNAVNAVCLTSADCLSPGTCGTAKTQANRVLANWGSSTSVSEDLRLTGSSPLRDSGTNTPLFGTVPSTDFDDLPRPTDGDQNGSAIIDIGAFEFRVPDSDGDGVEDSSDCAPLVNSAWMVPDQVPNPLAISGGQVLSWLRIPQSNVYNVYSGTVTIPFTYSPACLVPEVPGLFTSVNVGPAPGVGTAFYYLVGGVNACGSGPLHFDPTVYPSVLCTAQNRDSDTDGRLDLNDNCPTLPNPVQEDPDHDTVGSVCDNCPAVYNPDQGDPDADGYGSACDNCPSLYNPTQLDTNSNGIGDNCEDADADTYPLTVDCNDNNAAIHPGATEVCNGYDDNCVNGIDEGGGALCTDTNVCTQDVCAGLSGCQHPPVSDGTLCSDGNACTQTDTCQAGVCTGANPVVCTAPDDCHNPGTCNAGTGICSTPLVRPDGTLCSDGNACTQTDTCLSGVCTGANPVVCTAPDDCHDTGTCDPGTGTCLNPPVKADGTLCSDGNLCTQTDTCLSGVCTGANPVVCTAPDDCHDPGTCDPGTGVCSTPPVKPDGTLCSDGNACTQTDTCLSGVCEAGDLRDSDADGHPDSLCGGDDCNDTNPLVWHAPVEVTNLAVTTELPTSLSWNSQAVTAGSETTYDLVSGGMTSAPGMNFPASTCLLSADPATAYSDGRPTPSIGYGFWYLARARNSCGVSTYGTVTRDTTIPPCP